MFNLNSRSAANLVVAAILVLCPAVGRAGDSPAESSGATARSVDAAYQFLDAMMDASASGNTVRLSQSYSDQLGLLSSGFTYDNAVMIMAYLSRGTSSDLARAQTLGNALVFAQTNNFPVADGRFAQAYYTNVAAANGPFVTPAAFPFFFYTSAVGDQAWAGMALAQLYSRTRNQAYLTAALRVGNWIVTNTFDTQGPGGYRFGANINQFNQSVPSGNGKSTEHNIDVYAFFTMLSRLTRNGAATNGSSWTSLANHARSFVQAMYNPTGGFFYTGTNADQITIFTGNIPEDPQTWSFLAFQDPAYARSLDWVTTNLITIDTPSAPFTALTGNTAIQGETFASASLASGGNDTHAVWLEGTAHTVAALLQRKTSSDDDNGSLTTRFLTNLRSAQSALGLNQTVNGRLLTPGQGLVAATGRLDTGFGFSYFPNLHIGATGWYVIAAQAANPFQLGLGRD